MLVSYVKLLHDGSTKTENHYKEYLLRNVIHHLENTNNTYTKQEPL